MYSPILIATVFKSTVVLCPVGKMVSEKTMCEVLDSSGVECTEWGEIGIKLEMDSQMLGDIFIEGWKKFDPPVTWEKLASGLDRIPGSCYKGAVEKCRNNAGMF